MIRSENLDWAEAANLLKLGLCQAVQYQDCPYQNDDLYWTLNNKNEIIRNYKSGGYYGKAKPQEILRKFKVLS